MTGRPGAGLPAVRRARPGLALALLSLSLCVPLGPTAAQGLGGLQSGDQPLEINAEDGIEWRRDEQLYIARGNAEAIRGEITVYADVMQAHYIKTGGGDEGGGGGGGGGTDIDRIDIEGNVRIVSPSATVYGDRGAYDVINGVLVLVGDDLRLESGDDLVTARDSLEYWERKNMAVARGAATATREDKRIQADVLTAYFKPDADADAGPDAGESLKLSQVDGYGNVSVFTATEFASGDRGVYYMDREFATLSGSVKITREENQLNGEYAEIDMKAGVSRLLPGPPGSATTARVRGLLMPKRKPKTDEGS